MTKAFDKIRVGLEQALEHAQSVHAVAYMRTSSATNVGGDSDKRQRASIEAYASEAGISIADGDWFYDAAVKGADPITARPGFSAMLDRIAGNGVRSIIVESPDRFARDLAVQLAGHDYLKKLGISLIPASAPEYFLEETPTAVLVRQVLGAIAEFEKANLVAKLKAARERKRAITGKCGGRKSHAEINPAMVALARELSFGRSLRQVADALTAAGYMTRHGKPFSAMAVRSMVRRK